ncbi:MAG: hypothetical protein WA324_30140 [Bryobacteraceae bacterium]
MPPIAPTPAATPSYLDLEAGGSLRIVVPLLKASGSATVGQPIQQNGNTFLVSAANLAGYDISYYSLDRAPQGCVRLKFAIARVTRDDRNAWEDHPPALPFDLPLTAGHIRLIYLVRQSQSDHNMAIVASKNLDALNIFTKQFENHPEVCRNDRDVTCSWVPLGVAVRPESQPPPKPKPQ